MYKFQPRSPETPLDLFQQQRCLQPEQDARPGRVQRADARGGAEAALSGRAKHVQLSAPSRAGVPCAEGLHRALPAGRGQVPPRVRRPQQGQGGKKGRQRRKVKSPNIRRLLLVSHICRRASKYFSKDQRQILELLRIAFLSSKSVLLMFFIAYKLC